MPINDQGRFTIIFSTFILFVALFVFILFLVPKLNNIKSLANDVQQKKVEYELGLLRVSEAERAKDLIAQSKSEGDRISVALPFSAKAEDAILQLSSAATDSGLSVTSAEVVAIKDGILSVAFSTHGTFENTIGVLDRLKKNLRPIKIVQLDLIRDGEGQISADYSLEFPYLYQPAPSPQASSTTGGVR